MLDRSLEQEEVIADPNPYYMDAFFQEMRVLWDKTPFANQIGSLCYHRALTCFLEDDPDSLEARRKLLYAYLTELDKTDSKTFVNKIRKKLPTRNNLFGKIRRNLFSAYSEAPRRKFSLDEKQNSVFDELYRRSSANSLLQEAYRSAGFTNVVAVRPIVRRKLTGKVVLEHFIILPDQFRVLVNPDDCTDVREMWIAFQGEKEKYFEVWTPEQYRRVDLLGNLIGVEEENRYGRIPYEFLRLRRSSDFWGGGLFSVVETQLYSNKLQVLADENVTFSALSVWLAINMELASKFNLAPGVVVKANDVRNPDGGQELPPSLESISATAYFDQIDEHRKSYNKEELRSHGLSTSLLEDNPGTPQSGIAKLVEGEELTEERNRHVDKLRYFEENYAELVALIGNIDMQITPGLSTALVDFSIDFEEPRYYLEIKDEYTLDETKLIAGLISPLHFVKKWSGNDALSSNTDAIKYIKENIGYFEQMKAAKEPNKPQTTIEVQSPAAEVKNVRVTASNLPAK